MSAICARCGLAGSYRNKLINCCGLGCLTKIHDNCLLANEGRILDGHLVWLCAYHTRNSNTSRLNVDAANEPSRSVSDNESRNQNQSVNLIDTDNAPAELIPNLANVLIPTPSLIQLENNSQSSANNGHDDCNVDNNEVDPSIRANASRNEINEMPSLSNENNTADNFNVVLNNPSNLRNSNNNQQYLSSLRNEIPQQRAFRANYFRNNMSYGPRNNTTRNGPRDYSFRANLRQQTNQMFASSPRNSYERNQSHIRLPNFSSIHNSIRMQNPTLVNSSNRDTLSSVNDSVVEMMQKFSLRDLPEVTNSHVAWSTFYETYQTTKNLFLPHENVTRIQKAIKDPEVLQIGGPNLLNIRTFDLAIEKINGRLSKNVSFINKEANILQSYAKMRPENYKKLSEFIDKVVNFNHLAIAYNEYSFTCNKIFINGLAEKLPIYLHNKWITKQSQVEFNGESITLSHFVEVLELELPNIDTKIQNSLLPGFDLDSKMKPERQRVHKVEYETTRQHNSKFDGKICWFHKNSYHPTHECRNLWEMNGDAVYELARLNERCNICGQGKHNPCPYKSKLKCSVDGCNENHHALYCLKRKAKNSKIKINNNGSSEEEEREISLVLRKEEEELINLMNERRLEIEDSEETDIHLLDEARASQDSLCITTDDSQVVLNLHEGDKYLTSKSSRILLGVIVLRLENKLDVAFLVDTGSTASLIEESVANTLGLSGPKFVLKLVWTGNQRREEENSRIVKIRASKTHDQSVSRDIYFRTVKDLKVSSQRLVVDEIKTKYPYLKDLELDNYDCISGIIGLDNIWMFKNKMVLSPNQEDHMPIGVRCELGDYIMQSQYPLDITYLELEKSHFIKVPELSFINYCKLTSQEIKEYEKMEEEVLELENFLPFADGREVHEDKLALELMSKDIKRIQGSNQFEAPLLWKKPTISLPTHESYILALRRYFIVEKNALANNKFEECEAQVKNLLEKNYAKELSYNEVNTISSKTFYIPIFFISPEGKRTRMIWDMAAEVNGKSLNDELMAGPNLYNDILKINFQISEHPYLLKGDLKEMFHQIRLKEEDTDCLRFIFRFKGEEKIRIFKMLVLPFGAKCSPAISQFVKNLIANENLESKPLAAKLVLNSTYVDDVVKSFRDKEVAEKTFFDIREMLKRGGFSLLKINSNNSSIIKNLREKLEAGSLLEDNVFSSDRREKLLGYNIDFEEDTLSLAFNMSKLRKEIREGKNVPTKRELLRVLMSIYDPLGLVQFVTSKLKLLYRKTHLENLDWDDKIPYSLINEWKINLSYLESLSNIKIPRCYCYEQYDKAELWAFGDAGKNMLCCTIYARFLSKENKQLNVRLIYSKTFTIPSHDRHTIPELELQASCNLSKMVKFVLESHEIKFQTLKYFTDNAAVFDWIKNDPKKPTVYVKNRIEQINATTEKKDWHWIPTEYMPADLGTKETSMTNIDHNNDWYMPKIFRCPESDWPKFEPMYEQLNNTSQEAGIENRLDPMKVRSHLSLIYAGQFFYKLREHKNVQKLKKELMSKKALIKDDPKNKDLIFDIRNLDLRIKQQIQRYKSSTFMRDHVENLLFRQAQEEAFSEELKILRKNKTLPKRHYLYRWLPWIDENGVLRVKTRLEDNEENKERFGYDRIFPIVLPKDQALTKLIILKLHRNNKHMLLHNVENQLKARYFVRHIRAIVKNTIKLCCAFCIRYNARPMIPLMGDIPSVRLGYYKGAFKYAIADIAGPVLVKLTRNVRAKRYIFVYSCLTTRAIHLELIESLDSNSTLLALQSVITLRGAPERIVTDNGTNFVGSNNKMKNEVEIWNRKLEAKGIIKKPIEWDFGPARAPHMQGAVESLIRLVKTAMKKVLYMLRTKTEVLNDFALRGILMEVAGLLNNRPLTLAPMEDLNNEFLTPNCFLMLRSNFQEIPYSDDKMHHITKNWEDVKQFTKILWKNWLMSYLPTLLEREKWHDKVEPLKEGDIVVTIDTTVSDSWRLGRILKIKPGSKNQVRQVEIILGKKNVFDRKNIKTRKGLRDLYQAEKQSIVTRPATAVAKIQLNNS